MQKSDCNSGPSVNFMTAAVMIYTGEPSAGIWGKLLLIMTILESFTYLPLVPREG